MLLVRRYPYARVFNFKLEERLILFKSTSDERRDDDSDVSPVGKLEGIRDQVYQNLFYPSSVRGELALQQSVFAFYREAKAFGSSLMFKNKTYIINEISNRKFSRVQGENSSFNLCEIEDIFSQIEQKIR